MPDEPKTAVVPLALAQRLLRMEGRATELAVAVHRLEEAPQVAARLREALGPDYEVHTWDDILVQVKEGQARNDASMGLSRPFSPVPPSKDDNVRPYNFWQWRSPLVAFEKPLPMIRHPPQSVEDHAVS